MHEPPEDIILPRRPVFDQAWGEQFEQRMTAYLEHLQGWIDDPYLSVEDAPETLSGEPYCGCPTCHERETWLMATALALEGYEAGQVRLEDPEEAGA